MRMTSKIFETIEKDIFNVDIVQLKNKKLLRNLMSLKDNKVNYF